MKLSTKLEIVDRLSEVDTKKGIETFLQDYILVAGRTFSWATISFRILEQAQHLKNQIVLYNILRFTKSHLKKLVLQTLHNSIELSNLYWMKLDSIWNTLVQISDDSNFDCQFVLDSAATILSNLIDLRNLKSTKLKNEDLFDVQDRINFIFDKSIVTGLNVFLHCQTFLIPKYRKSQIFIAIFRVILRKCQRASQDLDLFLRLSLIAKVVVNMCKTHINAQNKMLIAEMYNFIRVPDNLIEWSVQNKIEWMPSNPTLKRFIKSIDPIHLHSIIYSLSQQPEQREKKIKTLKKILKINGGKPLIERNKKLEMVNSKNDKPLKMVNGKESGEKIKKVKLKAVNTFNKNILTDQSMPSSSEDHFNGQEYSDKDISEDLEENLHDIRDDLNELKGKKAVQSQSSRENTSNGFVVKVRDDISNKKSSKRKAGSECAHDIKTKSSAIKEDLNEINAKPKKKKKALKGIVDSDEFSNKLSDEFSNKSSNNRMDILTDSQLDSEEVLTLENELSPMSSKENVEPEQINESESYKANKSLKKRSVLKLTKDLEPEGNVRTIAEIKQEIYEENAFMRECVKKLNKKTGLLGRTEPSKFPESEILDKAFNRLYKKSPVASPKSFKNEVSENDQDIIEVETVELSSNYPNSPQDVSLKSVTLLNSEMDEEINNIQKSPKNISISESNLEFEKDANREIPTPTELMITRVDTSIVSLEKNGNKILLNLEPALDEMEKASNLDTSKTDLVAPELSRSEVTDPGYDGESDASTLSTHELGTKIIKKRKYLNEKESETDSSVCSPKRKRLSKKHLLNVIVEHKEGISDNEMQKSINKNSLSDLDRSLEEVQQDLSKPENPGPTNVEMANKGDIVEDHILGAADQDSSISNFDGFPASKDMESSKSENLTKLSSNVKCIEGEELEVVSCSSNECNSFDTTERVTRSSVDPRNQRRRSLSSPMKKMFQSRKSFSDTKTKKISAILSPRKVSEPEILISSDTDDLKPIEINIGNDYSDSSILEDTSICRRQLLRSPPPEQVENVDEDENPTSSSESILCLDESLSKVKTPQSNNSKKRGSKVVSESDDPIEKYNLDSPVRRSKRRISGKNSAEKLPISVDAVSPVVRKNENVGDNEVCMVSPALDSGSGRKMTKSQIEKQTPEISFSKVKTPQVSNEESSSKSGSPVIPLNLDSPTRKSARIMMKTTPISGESCASINAASNLQQEDINENSSKIKTPLNSKKIMSVNSKTKILNLETPDSKSDFSNSNSSLSPATSSESNVVDDSPKVNYVSNSVEVSTITRPKRSSRKSKEFAIDVEAISPLNKSSCPPKVSSVEKIGSSPAISSVLENVHPDSPDSNPDKLIQVKSKVKTPNSKLKKVEEKNECLEVSTLTYNPVTETKSVESCSQVICSPNSDPESNCTMLTRTRRSSRKSSEFSCTSVVSPLNKRLKSPKVISMANDARSPIIPNVVGEILSVSPSILNSSEIKLTLRTRSKSKTPDKKTKEVETNDILDSSILLPIDSIKDGKPSRPTLIRRSLGSSSKGSSSSTQLDDSRSSVEDEIKDMETPQKCTHSPVFKEAEKTTNISSNSELKSDILIPNEETGSNLIRQSKSSESSNSSSSRHSSRILEKKSLTSSVGSSDFDDEARDLVFDSPIKCSTKESRALKRLSLGRLDSPIVPSVLGSPRRSRRSMLDCIIDENLVADIPQSPRASRSKPIPAPVTPVRRSRRLSGALSGSTKK